MGRKAWLRPRRKKIVKGHLRVTKHGAEWISPFLHEYPHAPEELKNKPKGKKEAYPKGEKLQPNEKEMMKKGKEEMACRLGV